ncbi:MAG: hypothetical protein K0U20_08380 [Proteobacteria bacterium]|nr:hypothetical protein [Pseudomonadota bacterium]
MSLSTYDDLVKAIASWGIRDDLNTEIPDFILIAETEMYNNERQPLKVRDMETITTTTTEASRYIDLPDRYESMLSIKLIVDSGSQDVTYKTPGSISVKNYTGRPAFYTIIGDQIEFDRVPDQTYTVELVTYVRPLGLSDTNQTNSILENFPNIYLFGALGELFTRSQEDAQAQKYNLRFMNAIKGANISQKRGGHGAAPAMTLKSGRIV